MEIDPSDSTAPVVVAHFRDDWATRGVQVWNHHPHFWGV